MPGRHPLEEPFIASAAPWRHTKPRSWCLAAERRTRMLQTERRFEAPGLWGRFMRSRLAWTRRLSTLCCHRQEGRSCARRHVRNTATPSYK